MFPYWQLHDHSASFVGDQARGIVNVLDPSAGVRQLYIDGQQVEARLLQARFIPAVESESLLDHYVRGADLIATYAEQPARPFRPQLYWRGVSCAGTAALAALELIASVQTNLLDSRPRLVVESAFRAAELWCWTVTDDGWHQVPIDVGAESSVAPAAGSGCLLVRIASSALSCALVVPPSDDGGSTVACRTPDWVTIGHPLFTRSLEKGVILRARVRAVVVPRAGDTEQARQWYREVLASELPLTA